MKIMKIKFMLCAAALLMAAGAKAQNAAPVPHKVSDVKLYDLNNNPCTLPEYGKKNLLIFFIDPDKHKQNQDFTEELEANGRAKGPGIVGFGIVNAHDSGWPTSWIVPMARKRTEKNGATVIVDKDGVLPPAWKLGDCDNMFVLLLVSKEGELIFMRKGELTNADKAEFYKVVADYLN